MRHRAIEELEQANPFRFSRVARLIFALAAALALAACLPGKKAAEEPPEGPLGQVPVRIPWAYKGTVENNRIYGYNLYRSENKDAGFTRVNESLILPTPENPNPEYVLFTDRGLPLDQVYYYYLEAILEDGTKIKATPVAAQKVEIRMSDEEVQQWLRDRKAQKERAKKEAREKEKEKKAAKP